MNPETLTPDTIRAWTDAIGPTALLAIVLFVVVIPMIRRDRREGHAPIELREFSEVSRKVDAIGAELSEFRVRMQILWQERDK